MLAGAYAAIGFGQRMADDLAADLFAHLQRLSLRFHSRKPVGDTIRRVTADSAPPSPLLCGMRFIPALSAVVSLGAMIFIMWQLDAVLTVLSLAVVPSMAVAFKRYAGPMVDESYRRQEAEGRMYDVVEQTFSAIPVVQIFAQEERADLHFAQSTGSVLSATLALTNVQLRFKMLIRLATALGTACILWVGAQHVLNGSLTVGASWCSYHIWALYMHPWRLSCRPPRPTERGGKRAPGCGDIGGRAAGSDNGVPLPSPSC